MENASSYNLYSVGLMIFCFNILIDVKVLSVNHNPMVINTKKTGKDNETCTRFIRQLG